MKLDNIIAKAKVWSYSGGIYPAQKKSLSNEDPIAHLPLFDTYYVPLQQHNGNMGRLLVKVGDQVLKGQALTQITDNTTLPVHAPTSGRIEVIEARSSNHMSGLPVLMCTITADGLDTPVPKTPHPSVNTLSATALIDIIQNAGICGLGGAVFPTHRKLNTSQRLQCLIVNGVECEPYITADDRLMRENMADILNGIQIVQKILHFPHVLFAIEDNKPEAIAAYQAAVSAVDWGETQIHLRSVPTKYPSGGERQLIEVLTGHQVPPKTLPIDMGILMHNVGTLFAIKRAVYDGETLLERVVTITGEGIPHPQNYWVRLGTPVHAILTHVNWQPRAQQKVIIGGPMMGYTLPSLDVPVVKATNCILVPQTTSPNATEINCIRCGACVDVCPANLLPQQLYWYAKGGDQQKSKDYHLFDCIECGCCAFVCPSNIPLVQYYRMTKAQITQSEQEARQAKIAKDKFEARQARLAAEKQARRQQQERANTERTTTSAQQDLIAAAIARAKAKKQSAPTHTQEPATKETPSPSATPTREERLQAALAKAKQKRNSRDNDS